MVGAVVRRSQGSVAFQLCKAQVVQFGPVVSGAQAQRHPCTKGVVDVEYIFYSGDIAIPKDDVLDRPGHSSLWVGDIAVHFGCVPHIVERVAIRQLPAEVEPVVEPEAGGEFKFKALPSRLVYFDIAGFHGELQALARVRVQFQAGAGSPGDAKVTARRSGLEVVPGAHGLGIDPGNYIPEIFELAPRPGFRVEFCKHIRVVEALVCGVESEVGAVEFPKRLEDLVIHPGKQGAFVGIEQKAKVVGVIGVAFYIVHSRNVELSADLPCLDRVGVAKAGIAGVVLLTEPSGSAYTYGVLFVAQVELKSAHVGIVVRTVAHHRSIGEGDERVVFEVLV